MLTTVFAALVRCARWKNSALYILITRSRTSRKFFGPAGHSVCFTTRCELCNGTGWVPVALPTYSRYTQ